MAIDAHEYTLRELTKLYDAEQRFLDAQHLLLEEATDSQLQQGLNMHIEQTGEHLGSLERILAILDRQRQGVRNEVAAAIVAEAQEALQHAGSPAWRDCAIDHVVSTVEHFEIACYTDLVAAASAMGWSEVQSLLEHTLRQEQQMAYQAEQIAPRLLEQASQGAERSGTHDGGARDETDSNVDVGTSAGLAELIREME